MTSAGPSSEETGRFIHAVQGLVGETGGRFGIALSGGPDSLALLLLARSAFAGRVAAATVDHQLRLASAEEALAAGRQCAALGIDHQVLLPAAPISGNVQSAARAERYRLLEAWRREQALDWLMTAHHADDQAETLVMRLNRASGLPGLSGIRGRSGAILRPLLAWRRDELAKIAAQAPFPPVEDPSNADPLYDRARLRPWLASANWVDKSAWSRSAAALQEADQALEWMTAQYAARIEGKTPPLTLDAQGLPTELRRRLLLAVLRRIDPEASPRGEQLTRLLGTLDEGGTATLGRVKATGGRKWRFEPAPPRRNRPKGLS